MLTILHVFLIVHQTLSFFYWPFSSKHRVTFAFALAASASSSLTKLEPAASFCPQTKAKGQYARQMVRYTTFEDTGDCYEEMKTFHLRLAQLTGTASSPMFVALSSLYAAAFPGMSTSDADANVMRFAASLYDHTQKRFGSGVFSATTTSKVRPLQFSLPLFRQSLCNLSFNMLLHPCVLIALIPTATATTVHQQLICVSCDPSLLCIPDRTSPSSSRKMSRLPVCGMISKAAHA
jgi:hypothetical protein